MDLNSELMSEQIALHRARIEDCASRREGYWADARMIRRTINHQFPTRTPFPAVTA